MAPAARDGHTSSVAGSKMIIFGGRGNGSESDPQAGEGTETFLLGDEWEIDLDPSQHITVATDAPTVSGIEILFGFAQTGIVGKPSEYSMGGAVKPSSGRGESAVLRGTLRCGYWLAVPAISPGLPVGMLPVAYYPMLVAKDRQV